MFNRIFDGFLLEIVYLHIEHPILYILATTISILQRLNNLQMSHLVD